MNILDNVLVRKYFETPADSVEGPFIALAVLDAMQQPILKGERYLGYRFSEQTIKDEIALRDQLEPYHPGMLRLPDAFQKQERKEHCGCACWCTEPHCFQAEGHKPTPSPEKCGYCGAYGNHGGKPCEHKPKDEVEEKITYIISQKGIWRGEILVEELFKELRDLVRLAMETK